MDVKIVLGSAFGDEGKGVTTQWLCKEALEAGKKPIVIRFSGGCQAAHTIRYKGIEHICSTFGSGVLLDIPTLFAQDTYFDPISAKLEYEILTEKGYSPILYIDQRSRIVTPYDVAAGRLDSKVLKDGTCGKGIFPTFERYNKGVFLWIFNNKEIQDSLKRIAEYYNLERNLQIEEQFIEAVNFWKERRDGWNPCYLDNYDTLIFEGSQGLLLDMDRGFFPNVTPSSVGLSAIPSKFLKNAEVFLVTRTYLTRHGNGYTPIPTSLDLTKKYESNKFNEFQGSFKVGIFDSTIIRKACERHCLDNYPVKFNCKFNIVITHADVVLGCPSFEFINTTGEHCTIDNSDMEFLDVIQTSFPLPIKEVFYNDSPESNIKRFK